MKSPSLVSTWRLASGVARLSSSRSGPDAVDHAVFPALLVSKWLIRVRIDGNRFQNRRDERIQFGRRPRRVPRDRGGAPGRSKAPAEPRAWRCSDVFSMCVTCAAVFAWTPETFIMIDENIPIRFAFAFMNAVSYWYHVVGGLLFAIDLHREARSISGTARVTA